MSGRSRTHHRNMSSNILRHRKHSALSLSLSLVLSFDRRHRRSDKKTCQKRSTPRSGQIDGEIIGGRQGVITTLLGRPESTSRPTVRPRPRTTQVRSRSSWTKILRLLRERSLTSLSVFAGTISVQCSKGHQVMSGMPERWLQREDICFLSPPLAILRDIDK